MSKLTWQDVGSVSVFTKRNATMRDLIDKEVVQYYSANTKLTMVQKTNYQGATYYRTASARDKDLDWGFEATAFGLPNEVAPSAPSKSPRRPAQPKATLPQAKKQKPVQKAEPPKDGEEVTSPYSNNLMGRLRRLFRK